MNIHYHDFDIAGYYTIDGKILERLSGEELENLWLRLVNHIRLNPKIEHVEELFDFVTTWYDDCKCTDKPWYCDCGKYIIGGEEIDNLTDEEKTNIWLRSENHLRLNFKIDLLEPLILYVMDWYGEYKTFDEPCDWCGRYSEDVVSI